MKATHRYLLTCAALGCSAVYGAPFLAIGDNAELFVTATAGVRYEDNVLLTQNNTVDDVVFRFRPGLELLFGKGAAISGSFVAQQTFDRYADNGSLDANLPGFFFNAAYDDQTKLKVDANASWERIQQNTRDITNAATLTQREITNAGVRGELAVTAKGKIGLGVNVNNTDYITPGFRDSSYYSVPLNYYFAITPKVDLSAGVRYRDTHVSGGTDYEDIYYNVGARGQFTDKLSGRLSIGFTDRDPDVGKDQSLLGMDFDLNYSLTPKTNLGLTIGNDFEAGSTGTSQKVFNVGLRGTTQINAQLSAQASVLYERVSYTSVARKDDLFVLGLSGSYAFNQHISAVLAYSLQDNDSNAAGLSYTANVISLSAVFRY